MSNLHNTFEAAMAYVTSLTKQIPAILSVRTVDNTLHLELKGTPDQLRRERSIRIVFGEPARDGWGYHARPERMEQAVIKAPRSKRANGYVVDQARVFKVRQDNTLNGAGIINALNTFIEHMAHVDRMDVVNDNAEKQRNSDRANNRAQLQAAGLEFGEHSNRTRMSACDIRVEVEAVSEGVNITLPSLNAAAALQILRELGMIAKVEA